MGGLLRGAAGERCGVASRGAARAKWASARCCGGATVTSTLSRSIARTTAAPTAAGVEVPRPGGAFAPASANMPASRMKPGATIEEPTPLPCRSVRRPSEKPRSPNLVAL